MTLGFDTATGVGTVGLVDGGEIIGEYSFGADESQSEKLLSSIDLLLTESELDVSDVKKVAVSKGPGSFTGLRIGISTAKGLALGLDVPLVGVPLTTCYYTRVQNYDGPVYTLIKDRRKLIYYAGFDSSGEKVDSEESIPIDDLEGRIDRQFGGSEKPVLIVGDAVPEHRDALTELDNVILSEGELNYPSGLQVAFLGEAIEEEEGIESLEPLYAQRPIAEVNWEDKDN